MILNNDVKIETKSYDSIASLREYIGEGKFLTCDVDVPISEDSMETEPKKMIVNSKSIVYAWEVMEVEEEIQTIAEEADTDS